MGSKKLLPHISALEGPSSLSPYKQIIVVNSMTKFTDKQYSVCAHTSCSNHRHVQIGLQWQFRIVGFGCKNNPSKCTVISSVHTVKSSHSQLVTTLLYTTVNSSH